MKQWKPKERQCYWFIVIDVNGDESLGKDEAWSDYEFDYKDNCFRTKALAQAALKEVKQVLKGANHG